MQKVTTGIRNFGRESTWRAHFLESENEIRGVIIINNIPKDCEKFCSIELDQDLVR